MKKLILAGVVTVLVMAAITQARVSTGKATAAAATTGAATVDNTIGVVTSEALTTAAGAAYTLTLTNSTAEATSVVAVSFANGTNTQGTLSLGTVTPTAGSIVIKVNNIHATEALNGTIKIAFAIIQ